MAKSRKSQSPEFLEKRRNAIVELAKRRGRRPTSSAATLETRSKVAKVIAPVAFAARPQPQN